MPVPNSITDLSTTAASNSPAGSDPIGGNLDDYLRAIQAIVRSESLNKSWEAPGHAATWLSGTQFTVPTDLTSTYRIGRRVKATLAGPTYAYSTITASAFAAGVTTVTVENDSTVLSSPISAIEVGPDSIAMIALGSLVASRVWVLALTATDARAGIVELATDAETQAGTDTARAITPANLKAAQIQTGTAQATTSGTSKDFTSIPSWVRRITVNFMGVSTSGASAILLQLGDSGGIETTGYAGAGVTIGVTVGAPVTSSDGFNVVATASAGRIYSGSCVISYAGSNTWVAQWCLGDSVNPSGSWGGAHKVLSGTLDRLRLTTSGGTDTFDAGSINIQYE